MCNVVNQNGDRCILLQTIAQLLQPDPPLSDESQAAKPQTLKPRNASESLVQV
jgi:hypothetical protein